MKINITKDMARFIVNEKGRKVICIFEGTSDLFLEYVRNNLKISPTCDATYPLLYTSKLRDKLYMPNKFVGIASCNPEDEFSVEKGKLLAYSRAKDKIHTSFFKRANTYVNEIDNMLADAEDTLNRYGSKIEANTRRRHAKIEEMIGLPEDEDMA